MFSLSGVNNMFVNELKKTLFKKRTIFIILALLVVQLFTIFISSNDSKIYTEKFNEIIAYYNTDSIDFNDYIDFLENKKLEVYSNHEYNIVGERLYTYENIKTTLKTEGDNLLDKKKLNMYQSPSSQKRLDFEIKKNLEKQSLDYKISDDYLINKVEEQNIIQLTSIILALYLIYDIFYDMFKNNLIDIHKTLLLGKSKSFIIKLSALFLILFVFILTNNIFKTIVLLFYENDISTSIAYIKPLANLQLLTSYFNYIILNVFITFIVSISFALIFLFILSMSSNITVSTIFIIFITVVSFWLNNFINPNSVYNGLIYFNLYYPFFTNILLYNTFSVGILEFNVTKTLLLLLLFIIPILSAASYYSIYNRKSKIKKLNFQISMKITSTTIHNIFNLLFSQKLIIPIILISSYTLIQYQNYSVVKEPSELYFEIYQKQFLGPIDEVTFELLDNEKQKLSEADQNLNLIQNDDLESLTMTEEEVSKTLSNKINLERVISEIEMIEAVGGDYYLNDQGTKLLFSVDSNFYNATFLSINMILVCIIASVSGGYEKSINVSDLISTTSKGYKKHKNNKYIIMSILVNLLIVFTYFIQYLKISAFFPIDLNAGLIDSINVLSENTIIIGYTSLVLQVLFISNIVFYWCFTLSEKIDYILVMIIFIIMNLVLIWIGTFSGFPSLFNILTFNIFNSIPLVIFVDLVLVISIFLFKRKIKWFSN